MNTFPAALNSCIKSTSTTEAERLFPADLLKPEDKKTVSYFQDSLRVTAPMFEYVEHVTESLSKEQRLFLKHLLACTLYRCELKATDYHIPVPSKTIEKYARGCDTFALRNLGLIHIKGEGPGKCREYSVANGFFDTFIGLSPSSIEDMRSAKFVNLFSGKPTISSPKNQKYLRSPTNKHPVKIPELLRSAMDCISPRPVNLNAMVALLNYRKAKMDSAVVGSKEFLSLRGKYINDRTCYSTVLGQVEKDSNYDGFLLYSAAHRTQKTGRLSEIGGGLQSASREMKFASTFGVPGLYNYDLVSSQVNGLIQEFSRSGLCTDWLKGYRDDPNAKIKYSSLVGVDVSTWKICLLATIMGSTISTSINSSVYNALIDYQIKTVKNADGLLLRYRAFVNAIKPLKVQLNKWHNILVSDWSGKSSDSRVYKFSDYKLMKNASGMKAIVGEIVADGRLRTLVNKSELKRKLAAFILQGQEAAFIHHLTILSKEFGFVVVANEHDGLITIGDIPEEAMIKAGELSGLENPFLKTKDIFDGSDDFTKEGLMSLLTGNVDSHNG